MVNKMKDGINPEKSAAKIFTFKQYYERLKLNIFGKKIPWNMSEQAITHLCVFLDKKLTGKIIPVKS